MSPAEVEEPGMCQAPCFLTLACFPCTLWGALAMGGTQVSFPAPCGEAETCLSPHRRDRDLGTSPCPRSALTMVPPFSRCGQLAQCLWGLVLTLFALMQHMHSLWVYKPAYSIVQSSVAL